MAICVVGLRLILLSLFAIYRDLFPPGLSDSCSDLDLAQERCDVQLSLTFPLLRSNSRFESRSHNCLLNFYIDDLLFCAFRKCLTYCFVDS